MGILYLELNERRQRPSAFVRITAWQSVPLAGVAPDRRTAGDPH